MRPELNHIWSCRDIDRLLDSGLRGPTILPEQARRHLENCGRCRELHAFMTSRPQTRKPSPEVLRRICAVLNSDLQPVSPLPRGRVIAGRILGAGGMIVLAVSLMKGAAGTFVMTTLQITATSVLFLVFAVLFAVSLSRQLVPGSVRAIPAPALIAAFLLAFAGSVGVLFAWHGVLAAGASDWSCNARGIAMALVASVTLIALLRRGAVQEVATFGATIGATSGLVAAAALQLNCLRQENPHLLAWHATVPIVSAAAGFIIGALWERRNERTLAGLSKSRGATT